jgi:hypothetical protein
MASLGAAGGGAHSSLAHLALDVELYDGASDGRGGRRLGPRLETDWNQIGTRLEPDPWLPLHAPLELMREAIIKRRLQVRG